MPSYCCFSQKCNTELIETYIDNNKQVTDSTLLVKQLYLLIKNYKEDNDFFCWLKNSLDYADNYFLLDDYNWHIKELSKIINDAFFIEALSKKNSAKESAILICKAYGKRAWYYNELSKFAKARKDFEQIENTYINNSLTITDFDLPEYCYKSLSSIYTRFGDNTKAIKTIDKSIDIINNYNKKSKRIYDTVKLVGHYHNKAKALFNQGAIDSTLFLIYEVQKKYILNNHFEITFALLNAEVLLSKMQIEQPITKFVDNKELRLQIKNIILKLETLTNYFDNENFEDFAYVKAVYNETKTPVNSNESKYWYSQHLKYCKLNYNKNAREIAKAFGYVGHSYLALNNIDSAKQHFHLGLQTILPKYKPQKKPLPNKQLFFNENAIFENLEGLAEVFTKQDSLELALQAYELAFYVKLNLRSIYDFESSKLHLQQKAKEVNSKAIEAAYQMYVKTNDEQYIQRAFKIAESSRALVLLENIAKNQLLKQNENADSLFAEQKAKFDQPISISELETHLTENKTLIEYFKTYSALYAFKIEKENVPKFYQLNPNFPQLDKLLNALTSEETTATNFTTLANKVYKDIFEPLDIEPGKNITIIPDGQLNYLPFEALVTTSSNEDSFKKQQYLLQNHNINYQYSASIFAKLQQQTNKVKHNKVLGLATVFVDEIKEITATFNTDTLIGNACTKANILQKANQYNVLHFSTHANGGDQLTQQAHIVLHNDSLFLNDIYQQQINANLTVLSACETNIGKYEGGEGVMSLSRAFAYAGCPSLVSTLWKVNEESTKDIVVEFYKRLKKGDTKDEALKQAKLHYLKNTDDTNPYYWASMVAIGNMQPISISKQFPSVKLVLILLILVLGMAVFLFKNKSSKIMNN